MGLSSVFSTAVTGLQAAETVIDVAGNNVANSNTDGFKASRAVFATQFLQTLSLGSGVSNGSGGTNPRQIGLGTQVVAISPDFQQGTLEISSSTSDLAIQGDGLFIVRASSGEFLYTRNGKFQVNSENQIVTATGERLLGFAVDSNFVIQPTTLEPLSIPLGAAAVAQATQNVVFEGALTPTGDVADTPEILQSAVLSDGTREAPTDLAASNVVSLSETPAATSAVNATPGGMGAGIYRYRIVFVDTNGYERPASTATTDVTIDGTAAQSRIRLTLPTTGSTEFPNIRIYRTDDPLASASPLYNLVATVADGTATYDDVSSQATVDANPALNETTLIQGTYKYYVTFFNSLSGLESRPNALIEPLPITTPGQRMRLDNLPQPTTSDFDQIRIYRNVPSTDGNFYRLVTLNAGVDSYIDSSSDASIQVAANLINLDGPPINSSLALVDIVRRNGSTYERPFEVGSLDFTARKGGRNLETKTLDITATTRVLDLINFMNQAMGVQSSNPSDLNPIPGTPGGSVVNTGTVFAANRLQFVGNNGVDNALGIAISSLQITPTGGTRRQVNLAFASVQGAVGQSAVADFIVYDSLGIPLNVRVTAVLEARDSTETTYRWFADSPDNEALSGVGIAVGTGLIKFDGEGKFLTTTNSTVSIGRSGIPSISPMEFQLDFRGLSGLAASQATLSAARQDGFPPGQLTSYIIGEEGIIRGVFDNGTSRDLGQIRLARFANYEGLEQRGQNLFSAGVNSGLPVQGNPGEQGIGKIISGAIELSNTDISRNLVDLILASTQYRGNARVITAAQQLLDELLNLRR